MNKKTSQCYGTASLNVVTLTQRIKRQLLFNFVICNNIEVMAVQELAFLSCDIIENKFDIIANIGPRARGTGFLIRKGVGFGNVLYELDGRVLKMKLAGINIVNIYAAGKKRQKDDCSFTRHYQNIPPGTRNPILLC